MGEELENYSNLSSSVLKISKRNFVDIDNKIKMINCENPDLIKIIVTKNT